MAEVSARRTQTRARLVTAAMTVFAERGVLGASVEEICEAAGFTRGAFYSNFESKDDLCIAVLEHLASGLREATGAAIASLVDEPATCGDLDLLVRHAIGVFLRNQPDRTSVLIMIELRLHAVREESLRPGYLAFIERATSEHVDLIERTASDLGFRLTTSGPQAVALLQGVFEESALMDLIAGRPVDHPDRIEYLGAVLKSMLVPA